MGFCLILFLEPMSIFTKHSINDFSILFFYILKKRNFSLTHIFPMSLTLTAYGIHPRSDLKLCTSMILEYTVYRTPPPPLHLLPLTLGILISI